MQKTSTEAKKISSRKTELLRKGRLSIPYARYFLTLTAKDRKKGLNESYITKSLITTWREIHQSKDLEFHCGTVMPDHIHLLFTLGQRITLPQIVSKLKMHSKLPLKTKNIEWQANYFEHRLRPDTLMEPFSRYIFLNPYRKKLLPLNTSWSGWVIHKKYKPAFLDRLIDEQYPHPKWLSTEPTLAEIIETEL